MIDTRGGKEFDARAVPRRVPARSRACRSGRYDVEGVRIEKRVLMPHLQNTTHVTLPPAVERADPPRAAAAGRVPAARSAGQSSASPRRTRCTRSAIASRSSPGGDLPPLRLFLYGDDKAFTVHAGDDSSTSSTRSSRTAATSAAAISGARATSASTLAPDAPGTLVASTEIVGDDRRARSAGAAERRAAAGATRLIATAQTGAADGHGRGTGARRRSVHHHAGRAASRTRRAPARPATRSARSSPAITGSPTGAATR